MDFSDACLYCESNPGSVDCRYCNLGNPCYDCDDYNIETDTCLSQGGCANVVENMRE